ncbi:hypothetical protein HAX54_031646 [Datura stramonium]|uniref:ARID domain-containing protein n=1 Tax=Datura stramonium TaxID=4076 RepID=A0ABS8VCX8_DATST|nr:hypothetical protein [Datura stramonium]
MPRLGVLESMFRNKMLKMTKREEPPNYQYSYPPRLVSYDNIIDSPQLFMDTLKKLHVVLRSELMIPVIGGKALDLHRLFVEVTSRGGIAKVLGDKRWDEVALAFDFPSSSTNASYLLWEYYISLLFHFERIYYLKELFWTPSPHDVLHHVLHPPPGGFVLSSSEIEYFAPQTQSIEETFTEAPSTLVSGVIDRMFGNGYLVTVNIGSEDFKGFLYEVPINQELQSKNLTGKEASTTKKCDPTNPKRKKSG